MRFPFGIFSIILAIVLLSVAPASAQIVDEVVFQFAYPGGAPITDLYVEIYDESDIFIDGGCTISGSFLSNNYSFGYANGENLTVHVFPAYSGPDGACGPTGMPNYSSYVNEIYSYTVTDFTTSEGTYFTGPPTHLTFNVKELGSGTPTQVNAVIPINVPGSNPARNLIFELYDDNDYLVWYDCTTAQNEPNNGDPGGQAIIPGLTPGIYRLDVKPSYSGDGYTCGEPMVNSTFFRDKSYVIDISSGSSDGTYSNGTFTAYSKTLTAYTRYFKVKVIEGPPGSSSGPAVPGVQVNSFSLDDPNKFRSGVTDANGEIRIGIEATDSDLWGFDIYGQGITRFFTQKAATPGQNVIQVLATVLQTNANIRICMYSGDGTSTPFPLPSNKFGVMYCSSQNGQYFDKLISESNSCETVSVIAGTYDCRADVEGFASRYVTTTVAANQTKTINANLYQKNATVTFRLKNQNGATITGLHVGFSAWTVPSQGGTSLDDFIFAEDVSGVGQAAGAGISGQTYQASLFEFSDAPFDRVHRRGAGVLRAGGSSYVFPSTPKTFTSTTNTVVTFTLTEATAFVHAVVTGPNGQPLTQGWIDAQSPGECDFVGPPPSGGGSGGAPPGGGDPETGCTVEPIFSGKEIVNGEATLALVSGREYFISVFPAYTDQNQSLITPEPKKVTATDGTQELQFKVQEPNHTLTVNIVATREDESSFDGDFDFLHCYAYNSKNQNVFYDIFDNSRTANLGLLVDLLKPKPWVVGCFGGTELGFLDEDGPGDFFFGETSYKANRGSSTGQISLTISDFGDFFPQECVTFDADVGGTFFLPDGVTSIEIPGGAVGSDCTAEMCVESGRGYSFEQDARPFQPFDFSFSCDGNSVSEMNTPVEVCYTVGEDDLSKYGISVDLLSSSTAAIQTFDDSSKSWIKDAGAATITDNGDDTYSICAQLSHFTIWSLIVDVIEQQRSSGATWKTAQWKNGRFVGAWELGSDTSDTADVNVYEVELLKASTKSCSSVSEDTWENAANLKKKKQKKKYMYKSVEGATSARLKTSVKKGCARIRLDGGGDSDWRYTSFKTKRTRKRKRSK